MFSVIIVIVGVYYFIEFFCIHVLLFHHVFEHLDMTPYYRLL